MAQTGNGPNLPNTLQFEDTRITVVTRDGKAWLTCRQIDDALGQQRNTGASQIYNRHRDEFSDDMTTVIPMGRTRVRIFSPRGCHLIGMFARTERAKAFRRWVLDVLDGLDTSKPVQVRAHTRKRPQIAAQAAAAHQTETGTRRYLVCFNNAGKVASVGPIDDGASIINPYDVSIATYLREFLPHEHLAMALRIVAYRAEIALTYGKNGAPVPSIFKQGRA